MAFPEPVAGLVIRYSYLWLDEHNLGREEGTKDRPCAIVLSSKSEAEGLVVAVLPITYSPPRSPTLAVEIPASVKRRLGLDGARSWVVLDESNRFVWPGPDLRPFRQGDVQSVVYGPLPNRLFEEIRDRFVQLFEQRRASTVARTQ